MSAPLLSNLVNLYAFFTYLDEQGIPWRPLAQQCHFPDLAGEDRWITTRQALHFLQLLPQARSHPLGIEVALRMQLEQLSPSLAGELRACRDLPAAIALLMSRLSTLSNHVQIWPERREGEWLLCHRGEIRPGIAGSDQIEWFRAVALIQFCRAILGPTWWPARMTMSSARPAYPLPPALAGIAIDYGHAEATLTLPLAPEAHPFPAPPPSQPRLAALTGLADSYATHPHFDLPWFAALLGLSVRTLQRLLAQEGTRFRTLRDTARYRRARALLTDPLLTIDDIAWQCGYSDTANFNRAFRAWSGLTAARYRQRLKTGESGTN